MRVFWVVGPPDQVDQSPLEAATLLLTANAHHGPFSGPWTFPAVLLTFHTQRNLSPTLSQTWLSAQSFRTQAPKVSSPTEHPLKVTIPSMCHDEWCQLRSYCLEPRAKLHCLPVFCSLLTHVKAKEATPWKGFYWQPEGRQVMQVVKGARYSFASST